MASTPQAAYYEPPRNADAAHNLDEKEAEADIEHQLGWDLVFRQVERPWPKSAGETFHAWDSTSLLYSTMDADEMERFRDAAGYFTFRLVWPLPGHKRREGPRRPRGAAERAADQRSLPLRPAKTVDGFEPLGKMSCPEASAASAARDRTSRTYLAHGTVRGYTAPPVAELSKTKGSSKGVGIDPSPFDSIAMTGRPPKGRRVASSRSAIGTLDRHGGLTAWSAEQEDVGSVELYVLNPSSLMQIKKARRRSHIAEPSASLSGNPRSRSGGFSITVSTGTGASGDADARLRPPAQEQASLGLSGLQARPPQARRSSSSRPIIQSVHKQLERATALVTAQFKHPLTTSSPRRTTTRRRRGGGFSLVDWTSVMFSHERPAGRRLLNVANVDDCPPSTRICRHRELAQVVAHRGRPRRRDVSCSRAAA